MQWNEGERFYHIVNQPTYSFGVLWIPLPGIPLGTYYSCKLLDIHGGEIWEINRPATRPWRHRSWLFPRDPHFAVKAGRILDLYERTWDHQTLKEDEFVISADEKTSIRALSRRHPTLPYRPGASTRVEHEYRRCGAWAYLAALDVHQARVFGRCESKNGIAPFDRLVEQVMTRPPYDEARRVFWIVDNGSGHRGPTARPHLQTRYPRLVLVHGPLHASWLNQIEIYFSIVQRKVVTPKDFPSLAALGERLLEFQSYYQSLAKPFQWKFTRRDLTELLSKIPHSSIAARKSSLQNT